MDYDNLNSNLKYNIEHTMGYADVETSTDLVNKFILEKANDHNYEVIDLSLIHISEPTRRLMASRMPSSA